MRDRLGRATSAHRAVMVLKPGVSLDAPALMKCRRKRMTVDKGPRIVIFHFKLPTYRTGKQAWREIQDRLRKTSSL